MKAKLLEHFVDGLREGYYADLYVGKHSNSFVGRTRVYASKERLKRQLTGIPFLDLGLRRGVATVKKTPQQLRYEEFREQVFIPRAEELDEIERHAPHWKGWDEVPIGPRTRHRL